MESSVHSSRTNDAARCTACLKQLSGATDPIGGAKPKADDVSVCLYCGNFMIFQTDLTLRSMRQDEHDALPEDLRNELAFSRALASGFQQRKK